MPKNYDFYQPIWYLIKTEAKDRGLGRGDSSVKQNFNRVFHH